MTTVLTSSEFEKHQTGQHPENPHRIHVLREMLDSFPKHERLKFAEVEQAEKQAITAVHPLDHLQNVQNVARAGGGRLDADTVVSPDSYRVATLAAGTVCKAVQLVLTGKDSQALCLIRPPGHHAVPEHAMGFCLFNNVAIAARYAQQECDVSKILIIDWDVHHGNGTQDVFYDDETVTFFSIHRFPFYPGSGDSDETGRGKGLGKTFNEPVTFGTSRKAYLDRFEKTLTKAAEVSKPELILLSAGFDAHRLDPIGSLGLETEDFATLTNMVLDVAQTHSQGRLVSMLEGGYHPEALAASVKVHLQELLGD
ncbi:histone deacetylase [Thalassoglobus sp.]|uniref:histone deacetylase family protein n=1 Tax=Thalassoglobus sp. TaxID=2795869 RepID=UPI003AA7CD6E